MIDPDRVTQMAYLPGERVRAELGFNWDGDLTAVTAHFRKFVGSRYSARHLGAEISLAGKETKRVAEGDEVYTSVELEGVIPGSIDPGIYHCEFVHFHVPGRGWVLVFENLHLGIRVVVGPQAQRERERARLFRVQVPGVRGNASTTPVGRYRDADRLPSLSQRSLKFLT